MSISKCQTSKCAIIYLNQLSNGLLSCLRSSEITYRSINFNKCNAKVSQSISNYFLRLQMPLTVNQTHVFEVVLRFSNFNSVQREPINYKSLIFPCAACQIFVFFQFWFRIFSMRTNLLQNFRLWSPSLQNVTLFKLHQQLNNLTLNFQTTIDHIVHRNPHNLRDDSNSIIIYNITNLSITM